MSDTFAGLPISIPLRIVKTGEQHIRRTYWFTSTFTSGSQSINGLLVAYLRKNSIPYTRFLDQVWFVWNGCWCRCDYETEGLNVPLLSTGVYSELKHTHIFCGTGSSGADIYIMEVSIMDREELLANIENMTVGLDDTFKFHCTQCGKCCTYREDIILSPRDIYKMSKELNMHPVAFFNTYCRSHIGDVSRIPIVRLNSVGSDARCPLLKNNKCSVHKVKPAVCALFPLGRYIAADAGKDVSSQMEEAEVKYLLQPLECGDESETHTVREWLSGFDISLEDEFFIKWNSMIQKLGEVLKKQETKQDMLAMMEIWAVTRVVMYLKYDTAKPFMPQFEENCEGMMELLKDIPKLRAILHKAHADAMKQKGVPNAPYAM